MLVVAHRRRVLVFVVFWFRGRIFFVLYEVRVLGLKNEGEEKIFP